jgi:hypothetical protein
MELLWSFCPPPTLARRSSVSWITAGLSRLPAQATTNFRAEAGAEAPRRTDLLL